MEDERPHVNVVFFGPCGCGKSTTAGRLIADSGAIDAQSLERIGDEAAHCGKEHRRYAWILDKLRCERDRGGSMYIALWRLSSRRCRFTVIDAPGHGDFAKALVTAMSQADIGVLVVDAAPSDLVAGQACIGQIREYTLLAYTLGLRQLVVCVNKMDGEAVAYSEDAFDSACAMVREDLKSAGLKTHDVNFDVHFVPTSGCIGDNVVDRFDNMPWYSGPTLIEALDDAVASHFQPERALRLPLHDVMQIGGTGVIAVGRVLTGSVRPGTRLVFAPGNVLAEVTSLEAHHEPLLEGVSGDTVNVGVNVGLKDLKRGMVASEADDCPARECLAFLAQVIVLSPPRMKECAGEIGAGCVLWVECHTATAPCVFEELLSRTDRRTGEVLELKPQALHAGDAAVVRLRPQAPMCVESFSEYPPLGRFTVHDQKTTVAVGVVLQVDWCPPGQRLPSPVGKSIATAKASRVDDGLDIKQGLRTPNASSADARHTVDLNTTSGTNVSVVANSPFVAFGSVTKKKVKETPSHRHAPSRAFRADSGDSAEECTNKTAHHSAGGFHIDIPKNSPYSAFGAVTKKRAKETTSEFGVSSHGPWASWAATPPRTPPDSP